MRVCIVCLGAMQALAADLRRTMDLFRSWDDDESGCVDKHEFRSAIRRLTVSQHIGGEEVAEALFDLIDVRPACSTKPSCPRDP